jgi:hypothetical protein
MYLDVKSLVSTGIGNLLDADHPNNVGSNPHLLPDAFMLEWFDMLPRTPAARPRTPVSVRPSGGGPTGAVAARALHAGATHVAKSLRPSEEVFVTLLGRRNGQLSQASLPRPSSATAT